MSPRIRLLKVQDASVVCMLQKQSTGVFWTEKSTSSLLSQKAIIGWGAVLEENLIGFLLVQWSDDQADIIEIVVDQSHRRRGVGCKLLQACEVFFKEKGVREVFLEVLEENRPACSFYKALGFKDFGRRPDYYRTQEGLKIGALMKKRTI